MPKFIYTILILIFTLVSINTYVIFNLDADRLLSKIIFTVNFFITLNLLIPLLTTLYLLLVKKKPDIFQKFKTAFKGSLLFSLGISISLFLKIFFDFSPAIFLAIVLVFSGGLVGFKFLKNKRKKRIN